MKTLIILRGLPGSGKSTFADFLSENFLDEYGNIPICSADNFFMKDGKYIFDKSKLHAAHQRCHLDVDQAMFQMEPIILLSNTNTTDKEMEPYFELAKKYDYRVFSIIVENRHGNDSIHNVPNDTIDKMKNRFSVKL